VPQDKARKPNNILRALGLAVGGAFLCTACSNVGYTEKIPNDPFDGKIDHRVSFDNKNIPPVVIENADASIPLQGGLFTIDVSLMFPPESAKAEYGVVSIPKENSEQEQNVAVAVRPANDSGGRIVPITVSPRQPNTNAKPDTYVVAVLGGQADVTFQATPKCQKLSVVGRDLADVQQIYAGIRNSVPDHFLGFNTAVVRDAVVNYLDKYLRDPKYPKRVYSVTCDGQPAANVMIMAEPDQKGSEQPPETAPETLLPFEEDPSLVALSR
jgi:hypothetical protein